ncbi:hypothetical protein ANN_09633 [Periplaneta americana]|uniref:Reverse transcriptase n=1 Tax=Periplaneta americana TaxID=6978 RepID=A0ABQ8TLU3_PERAM|nr:hypothetical protein ANN_09633 [Periplaneta americana]
MVQEKASNRIRSHAHFQCPVVVLHVQNTFCECLFDTGSVSSLVSKEMVTKLGLLITPKQCIMTSVVSQTFHVEAPSLSPLPSPGSVSGITEPDSRGEIDLAHLPPDHRAVFQNIMYEFSDVLNQQLGSTTLIHHQLVLKDQEPVRLPPYRLSPPRMQQLKAKIQDMLQKGIIRPSTSNYSSPIFLVPKGQDDTRPVVDYRVLSSKMQIESVPLPDIHNCFDWFANAKYFTTFDLNSAYYNIPLAEESRPYTAFATDWNLYEFCRVQFGIATGAQVLTRLLDQIFSNIKYKFLYHYLDDLVVYSDTWEEHVLHIREVLLRLRKAGLTVKPEKVVFATQVLHFLGHLVTPVGVTIDPQRTLSVRQFPPPKNVKAVACFIADFQHPFILQTDACGSAIAAALMQETEDGCCPIAYASRALIDQERQYSIYELEALAVLFGAEKFCLYLEHVEFRLQTDNQALSWVLARPRKSGRLAHWALRLSAFRFTVEHIRGTQNIITDSLSRMFEGYKDEEPFVQMVQHSAPVLDSNPLLFHDVREAQLNDVELGEIHERLQQGNACPPYLLKQGLVCFKIKGKFPRSKNGNTYILTVVDAFSKFCWLVPVWEATTKSALHVLKGIIASLGCPRILVTDNATQFISNDFRKFCFSTGIQHITTVPYYPNPSQAERVNRNLRPALIVHHSQDHTSWDTQLDWLQFAFNSARHQSHKLIPFSLMMAYPPQSTLSNLWLFEDLLPDSPDPQQLKDL